MNDSEQHTKLLRSNMLSFQLSIVPVFYTIYMSSLSSDIYTQLSCNSRRRQRNSVKKKKRAEEFNSSPDKFSPLHHKYYDLPDRMGKYN
jgi:hypothetical protein